LHSRWAEQVTEQIYRYIDDHFPDGLHVPPDVSEDEAVIAVQNQFSDAGFGCPEELARDIVLKARSS
jgi:hypothetical protein